MSTSCGSWRKVRCRVGSRRWAAAWARCRDLTAFVLCPPQGINTTHWDPSNFSPLDPLELEPQQVSGPPRRPASERSSKPYGEAAAGQRPAAWRTRVRRRLVQYPCPLPCHPPVFLSVFKLEARKGWCAGRRGAVPVGRLSLAAAGRLQRRRSRGARLPPAKHALGAAQPCPRDVLLDAYLDEFTADDDVEVRRPMRVAGDLRRQAARSLPCRTARRNVAPSAAHRLASPSPPASHPDAPLGRQGHRGQHHVALAGLGQEAGPQARRRAPAARVRQHEPHQRRPVPPPVPR
jgi:hypothetical protein